LSIKGCGCADGRPQRKYIAREDASSPTIATESVFLTALIDAEEGRDVAIVDIPGAFMQAEMDEETFVRISGKTAELLLEIDKDMYSPHVMTEKGEAVLYVELLKALYGTLRAARLFWEKLSSQLVQWDFEINPYDRCVANKMVGGKQLTVGWHETT
jgi:Reverse transcriptase (RNA-dependent DNA polymerase)